MATKKPPQKTSSSAGTVFLAIFIVALIIGAVVMFSPEKQADAPPSQAVLDSLYEATGLHYSPLSSDFAAYKFAMEKVEASLKSPGTAQFPPTQKWTYAVKETSFQTYEINSYVDAQNSFGATIRNNWTAVVAFDGTSVKITGLKIE